MTILNQPVRPRGSMASPLYFVVYKPSQKDEASGELYGDSVGRFTDQMLKEAGVKDAPHFCSIQPLHSVKIDDKLVLPIFQQKLEKFRPPIIVTCDSRYAQKKGGEDDEKIWISDALALLCPETKGVLNKYAGSLLSSALIPYPHYIIPTYSPYFIWRDYKEKDITVFIDYGHVREEIDYWNKHKSLQPLPQYELITEPSFPELYSYLEDCKKASYVSTDIETIRPPANSRQKNTKYTGQFLHHPGYPYTLGLAPSAKSGISFSLWDYSENQLVVIWKQIDWILRNVPQIGQNYFIFDTYFLQALGFSPNIDICHDTLIRHHILWSSLPHKLQFQTRQYTRQPYYKDEGKSWTVKHKKSLMKYNALDVVTTFEVFNKQEEEFAERPYLI